MPIGDPPGSLADLTVDVFTSGYPKIRYDGTTWCVKVAFNQASALSGDCLTDTTEPYETGCTLATDPTCQHHPGEDWNRNNGADAGADVFAIGHGIVAYAGFQANYGNMLILAHRLATGEWASSMYAHLQALPFYSTGDVVCRGWQIGDVGSTGPSGLSPHLHFELRRGSMIDPSTLTPAFSPNLWPASSSPSDGGESFIAQHYYDPSSFLTEVLRDGFEFGDTALWEAQDSACP
jgi:hypothetical protein